MRVFLQKTIAPATTSLLSRKMAGCISTALPDCSLRSAYREPYFYFVSSSFNFTKSRTMIRSRIAGATMIKTAKMRQKTDYVEEPTVSQLRLNSPIKTLRASTE